MNSEKYMNKEKHKKLVLLDAHAILHRSYHGMPEMTDREGRPTGALYGYINMISRIKNDLKPDYIAACYDLPRPTFRHLAYDNYKGHRTETDQALKTQIQESYDVCKALNIPVYTCEGFEADDLLGTIVEIVSQRAEYIDIETIIASGDMDTMQLIGPKVKVYTLKKAAETVLYDRAAVVARYGFTPIQIPDYKAIAGDSSDNIIGVPGIGIKGATELIQKYDSLENIYKIIEKKSFDFKEAGMKERMYRLLIEHKDGAEFSKTLATIRRDAPIDFTLTPWIVNREDYALICDRFGFKSLRNKFDDYMEAVPASNLSKSEPANIISLKESIDYQREATMVNLLNSEMVNLQTEEEQEALIEKLKAENIKEEAAIKNGINTLYDYYKIIEEPLFKIINEMYDNGIQVSKEILLEQSHKLHILIDVLQKQIYEAAGTEFNINSPKQLGEILYDKLNLGHKIKKTKTGQKSTGIEMLNSMRGEHEIIPHIISYRELFKLVSTYIDTLPNFIKEDGRIHSRLVLNGAATGRFSCEHPNLQNLPARRGQGMEIRKAFQAGKGKKFISLDYSQIELRLAALLSGDVNLIQIFRDGIDVHAGVAALVYNKSASEINSDERRHAKAINFGILYGMGVTALRDSMGVDRIVAQQFYDRYKDSFPTLMAYLEKVKIDAREIGYTTTLFGRRRHIPLLRSALPFMRAAGERIAINAPVQGTGAEIVKFAMVDITQSISIKSDVKLLLQIHDELIFEINENDNVSAVQIKEIMETVLVRRGIDIVPIVVGVSEGHDMFELK